MVQMMVGSNGLPLPAVGSGLGIRVVRTVGLDSTPGLAGGLVELDGLRVAAVLPAEISVTAGVVSTLKSGSILASRTILTTLKTITMTRNTEAPARPICVFRLYEAMVSLSPRMKAMETIVVCGRYRPWLSPDCGRVYGCSSDRRNFSHGLAERLHRVRVMAAATQ